MVDGNDPDEVHATARRVGRSGAGRRGSVARRGRRRTATAATRAPTPGSTGPTTRSSRVARPRPDPDVPRAAARRRRRGRRRWTGSTPRSLAAVDRATEEAKAAPVPRRLGARSTRSCGPTGGPRGGTDLPRGRRARRSRRRWSATRPSTSSARTSRRPAACSRRPRDCSSGSVPSACATRRSREQAIIGAVDGRGDERPAPDRRDHVQRLLRRVLGPDREPDREDPLHDERAGRAAARDPDRERRRRAVRRAALAERRGLGDGDPRPEGRRAVDARST